MRGRCKEFYNVAVGIVEENLHCAVGSRLSIGKISANFFQMLLPRIQIIYSQREMIVLMAWKEGRSEIRNQMQFLIRPEAKPRSGKRKCGPRNRFEFQDTSIKLGALLDVGDIDRDMVQLLNRHCTKLCPCDQLPQNVRQYSAVLVIIDLDGRIYSASNRNIFPLPVCPRDSQSQILLRLQSCVQAQYIVSFSPVQFQCLSSSAFFEL